MAKRELTGQRAGKLGVATAETVIAWQAHEGLRVAVANGYDIIHCNLCGFRHVVPLPDPAVLAASYRENYYTETKPTFLLHASEDQDWAELAQNDRLDSFERLLGPQRRRLLDVGSGPGYFLVTAKSRGWRVIGIEPSRTAATFARGMGVEVVEGVFNTETAQGLGRFDVVHLNNVLEHVPDPIAIIAAARDLVTPGGLLCIGVPNDFSPFQVAARATAGVGEWWLAPPHHLNYFDFETLAALVARLGFVVADRLTSFPMEMFLLMGDNYTADSALGRACHARRKRFDLSLDAAGLKEARRTFYRALADAGMGREAVVVAVKT